MTPIAFGRRLRDLRLQHDLSQEDLADKLGIDKSYISKLENGKADYPPKEWVFDELALIFDVPTSELLLLCGVVPKDVVEVIGTDLSEAMTKAKRSGKSVKVKVTIEVHKDGSIELLE